MTGPSWRDIKWWGKEVRDMGDFQMDVGTHVVGRLERDRGIDVDKMQW